MAASLADTEAPTAELAEATGLPDKPKPGKRAPPPSECDDDDAGSLVDFVVDDEEAEPLPAEGDDDGVSMANVVEGKRVRKKPKRFVDELMSTDEYRRMMLCDVPAEEMRAALEDSVSDDEDDGEEGDEEDDGPESEDEDEDYEESGDEEEEDDDEDEDEESGEDEDVQSEDEEGDEVR